MLTGFLLSVYYKIDFYYFMFHVQSSLLQRIVGSPQYHFFVKRGFLFWVTLLSVPLLWLPVLAFSFCRTAQNYAVALLRFNRGLFPKTKLSIFISILCVQRILVIYIVIFFRVIMALSNPKTPKRGSKWSPSFVFLTQRTGHQPQNSRGK